MSAGNDVITSINAQVAAMLGMSQDAVDAMFPMAEAFRRARTTKSRGRPLAPQTLAIREAVLGLMNNFEQMTVRGIFYQLTVLGIVEKTEAGYRQVQRQVLLLRREDMLPWEFVADGTRWVHRPETWDSVDDVLETTIRTYRRNLWRSQQVRIEIWLEKDALASLIVPVTDKWDVRLMVSRGQSSDTYVHAAAQDAQRAWDEAGFETVVYTMYDADKSGRIAATKIEEKLRAYSVDVPITVVNLAVTDEQIDEWNLPTRPAKEKGEPDAVELDAIPPDTLIELVENTIIEHIDEAAWRLEQIIEVEERAGLEKLVGASS